MALANEFLRQYGHPRFYEILDHLAELHSRKNHDYAGGGDPLGNFDRVSAIKKLWPGLDWDSPFGTAFGYMLKQIDAVGWMRSQKMEAQAEAIPGRLDDMSVYPILMQVLLEEEKNGKNSNTKAQQHNEAVRSGLTQIVDVAKEAYVPDKMCRMGGRNWPCDDICDYNTQINSCHKDGEHMDRTG